jgi:hypothetical protein
MYFSEKIAVFFGQGLSSRGRENSSPFLSPHSFFFPVDPSDDDPIRCPGRIFSTPLDGRDATGYRVSPPKIHISPDYFFPRLRKEYKKK